MMLCNNLSTKVCCIRNIDVTIEQKDIFPLKVPFRPMKLSSLLVLAKCSCSLCNWVFELHAVHREVDVAKEVFSLPFGTNHSECLNSE